MCIILETRLNIALSFNRLAQYCESYFQSHWKGLKRIFRQINGTKNFVPTYTGDSNLQLVGYSDSSWECCRETHKSADGYVLILTDSVVTWKLKKKTVVASSSCEAEYVACFTAYKKTVWLS